MRSLIMSPSSSNLLHQHVENHTKPACGVWEQITGQRESREETCVLERPPSALKQHHLYMREWTRRSLSVWCFRNIERAAWNQQQSVFIEKLNMNLNLSLKISCSIHFIALWRLYDDYSNCWLNCVYFI